MALLNDVARCQGDTHLPTTGRWICDRRETCARYVERNTGGERTPNFAYLCLNDESSYISTETIDYSSQNTKCADALNSMLDAIDNALGYEGR